MQRVYKIVALNSCLSYALADGRFAFFECPVDRSDANIATLSAELLRLFYEAFQD